MLTNSCSSFSLNYQPLQHGSVKKIQLPLTQTNGLVNRRQSKKNSSIKCLFHLTNKNGNNEDIINRNHKPLNKSTVVHLALQEGYESKSKDVSSSFVDISKKKLFAFYRLCRPYASVSIIVAMLSSSLLPIQGVADLTPSFFLQVLKSMVPSFLMNIFVSTINELSDIEIDKVNKPDLPLASGDFSIGEGIALAVISTLMSLIMGVMLGSPPLVISLIIRWIVGAAYSINLPLLRWKGNPLMAALSIMILTGLTQITYFVHVQKYVLGRPLVLTKPLVFGVTIIGIFMAVLAFLKDIPDMEGDKKFGVPTLAVLLGKERVFSICVNMILIAYGAAILAGAASPFLLCKIVAIVGHSALGFMLWRQAQTIDLSDPKSTYSFFIFMFRLHYAEFFLIHFLR